MKNFKMLAVVAVLVVLMCSGSALAGVKAGAMTISPSGGAYLVDDKKAPMDDGVFYNLGLGYNFTQNVAAEFSFGVIQSNAKEDCNCADTDVYGFLPRIELLYHFMPDKAFVPYIAVGAGYLWYKYDNEDKVKYKADNSAIADYGLGAKLFLTDNLALRGDARHIYDFENKANDFALTVGLVYQFGGEEKKKAIVEPCKDSDKDGVCDDKDKCLNTPVGTPVDSTGCPRVYDTKIEKKTEPSPPIKSDDKKLPPPVVIKEVPKKVEERVEVTILFETDKTLVKPMYHDQLKKVADFMKANPTANATIEGHTDSIGSDKYNLNLSRKRSQSVKNYFVKKFGVDPNRIAVSWYGKSKPAADNKTEAGRKLNRRAITISIKK